VVNNWEVLPNQIRRMVF